MNPESLDDLLADAHVDPAVFALRPDYRALVIAVTGLTPGPGDDGSEAALRAAEGTAYGLLAGTPVEEVAQVASWREAYRAFGAKPQRTRNSLEALLRRAAGGLPRVNRLTDCYNAVSVSHLIPIGGEDLGRYAGAPRLLRATGEESFDTAAQGASIVEHPEPGEVVWADNTGVTCRRWNWRQARRTALTEATTEALFILDALDPVTDDELHAAGEELLALLRGSGPEVSVARRLLRALPV